MRVLDKLPNESALITLKMFGRHPLRFAERAEIASKYLVHAAHLSLAALVIHCQRVSSYFPGHDGLRFSPKALRPSLASSVIASKAIWLSV